MNKLNIKSLRPYLLLWSTQSLSALGSAMTGYALVLWLYKGSGPASATAGTRSAPCSYATCWRPSAPSACWPC